MQETGSGRDDGGPSMLGKAKNFLRQMRSFQMMNASLARGAAGASARQVNLADPRTWEFSGFSQNGEDGIIDVLSRQIIRPNRYFVEVGASDGLENNTAWLAMVRRFSGIWVEGDPDSARWCEFFFRRQNYGLEFLPLFVTRENTKAIAEKMIWPDPDVFSLDVDGNDYHFVESFLKVGIRPKIWVVEYNSAFGPDRSVTIPYSPTFSVASESASGLYYGCSVSGWRSLFARHGYRFVTVEQNGVNAFFVDPHCFEAGFLDSIEGLRFAENFSQLRQHGRWEMQFKAIEGKPLEEIS
jgi:hypothetical protein